MLNKSISAVVNISNREVNIDGFIIYEHCLFRWSHGMLFFLNASHNPGLSIVVLYVKLVTYSPLQTKKALMTQALRYTSTDF